MAKIVKSTVNDVISEVRSYMEGDILIFHESVNIDGKHHLADVVDGTLFINAITCMRLVDNNANGWILDASTWKGRTEEPEPNKDGILTYRPHSDYAATIDLQQIGSRRIIEDANFRKNGVAIKVAYIKYAKRACTAKDKQGQFYTQTLLGFEWVDSPAVFDVKSDKITINGKAFTISEMQKQLKAKNERR